MGIAVRVNGSWVRLLSDWMDNVQLAAPGLRATIAAYAPTDIVPLERWQEMLTEAFDLRPDLKHSSIAVATHVTPRHVGVLGYLIMACDTLGQALVTYQRYETLFYGMPLAKPKVSAHSAGIYWKPDPPRAEAEEVAIIALVHFIRNQVDESLPLALTKVSFCHETTSAHQMALQEYFGCDVEMGAEATGIEFPHEVLKLPLLQREPGLRELLEAQAAAMLRALPENDTNEFERQVQAQLVKMLPEGEANIEALAKKLHCSVRTLQRRLGVKNLTWKGLLDNTREQLARQYLQDKGLSLLDIALLLGYRDQGTFTRSFRRWSGTTPLAYRKSFLEPKSKPESEHSSR